MVEAFCLTRYVLNRIRILYEVYLYLSVEFSACLHKQRSQLLIANMSIGSTSTFVKF